MPNDPRLIGSPRRLTRSCFHLRDYRLASPDRSLVICYDLELILSRLRLFRAPSLPLLARHLSARASPAWVLGPLRDITRAQPHPRDGSHRRRFVPSPGFLSLSTVFSALGLAGLFHPAATSRVLPFRGLLSPRSHPSSSEGASPVPLLRRVLTDFRRLPHAADLGFEAFIRARPRSMQCRYSPHCTPLPSSGSSPPGPHFAGRSQLTCDLRSRRFASPRLRCSRSRTELVLSVSPDKAWRRVSAPPACSSFRAFLQTSVRVIPRRPHVAVRGLVPGGTPSSAWLPTQRALLPEPASIRLPESPRASRRTSSRVHEYRHGDFVRTTLPPFGCPNDDFVFDAPAVRFPDQRSASHDALMTWLRHAHEFVSHAPTAWLPTR
jgi:hypothetical protein